MIFIDASAMCAILLGEPEGAALAQKLATSGSTVTSAVACYETTVAVARDAGGDVASARQSVAEFLGFNAIDIVPIGDAEREVALDAFDRYGKGRHPARLNMGDCFAYACARAHGAALLFKGNDFTLTDITVA